VLLVAGLGNPGPKYSGHRHNVGFMLVDALAQRLRADPFRDKFSGQFARARLQPGGGEVVLLKPQTFMNLSGESVQKALAFFKLEADALLVVHDELDLPFGTLKLKRGGGTAGHNGLKSIVQHCGGPDFARLRLGIGRPPRQGVEHVLSDFSRQECQELPAVLERASLAVVDVVDRGLSAAMNAHNQASPKA
jgi:peptidyl-tRNA hydrolase, PTH1 family